MTSGDWIATAVLAGFAILGLCGYLKWVLRGLMGVVVGAVVLVLLGQAGAVSWLAPAKELLNDGRVTPMLTDRADAAAMALGLTKKPDPAAPVFDESKFVAYPEIVPAGGADPLAGAESWNVRARPVPYPGD